MAILQQTGVCENTQLPRIDCGAFCNTFSTQAGKIWHDLKNARNRGYARDERTVTNDFIRDIQDAHPVEVVTFQFNEHQEKFTGADWEWWLTDGKKWLGLLIQAKILNATSHRYSAIKHKVGKDKIPQINFLINQAKQKAIDPLYVFYNYSKFGLSKFNWNCRSTDPMLEQLGCTVAHAHLVKDVINRGGGGLPTLNPITLPLRCLVCCHGFTKGDASLPVRAGGVARILQRFPDIADTAAFDDPRLRNEPPSYVRRLLDVPLDDRARVMEQVRKEVGPVGSLIVMKEPD